MLYTAAHAPAALRRHNVYAFVEALGLKTTARIRVLKFTVRVRGGGCGGSKPDQPEFDGLGSPPLALEQGSTLGKEPTFELTTSMLVMSFDNFKVQGRIEKNVEPWRVKALAEGRLFEYLKVVGGTGKVKADGTLDGTIVICLEGKVVVFLSHTW